MCGIAGKINWDRNPGTDTVLKMCKRMVHRGPDDSGIINLQNITLGHRRLSIIDLSEKAHQPMVSDDNRYYIVYNGEVYNFKDLKSELEDLGVVFRSNSDTEVILYSYRQWGAKCLEKFNGMFAFAVWDNKLSELFLARDRFGKKPLYYYMDDRKMAFASELSALLCDDDIPRDLSYIGLNCYLALGYILSPMTFYKDVFKLEPASYMIVSEKGKRVEKIKYWDYAEKFSNKARHKEKDAAANILDLLDESVRKRMVSDVPIGAFLSGGIDSSSIVALMKKYHKGDLHTFSMGFDQKRYSELYYADRVAKCIGTIHHNRTLGVTESRHLMDEAIDIYDEPFADNSLVPTVELSKLTRSYVTVALSGDGADEIFAGYITYQADRLYPLANALPDFIKKILAGNKEISGSGKAEKLGFAYKQKQFFYGCLHTPEEAHYLWRLIFRPEERIKILGEEHRQLVYDTDPVITFKKYYEKVRSLEWLDRHLYVDAMTWLTDDILVKVDRASMSASLEVRCPYLDTKLVEYVASIPADMKMKGLKTKSIMRKALKGIIPDFVINRKKSGFNAPTGAWIGQEGVDEFKAFNRYVYGRKIKGQVSV